MNNTKAVETFASPKAELVVSSGIKKNMSIQQKVIGYLPFNIVAPGFYITSILADRALDPVSWGFILTAAIAGMGFTVGTMQAWKAENKSIKTSEFLGEKGIQVPPATMVNAIRQLNTQDKVLLKSFHIREATEINVANLKQTGNVAPHLATHEVKQYLCLRDKEFAIEQEVIPNEETIWDLSADALVEIYGVQEKTSLKRIAS